MKKKGTLLIAATTIVLLLSCQNELVQKIKDQLQVNTPVITETENGLDKVITINSTTPGAELYYTTDNTEPKPSNPTAILYTDPITLSGHGETLYIRARGFKAEMTPSGETVAQFGNVYPSPPPPVLSQSGGIFSVPQSIDIAYPDLTGTLWEADGVTIHYTLDGSSPTASSPVFQPGITPQIPVDPGTENYTATVILNAVCIHPAYPASRASSAIYTVSYTAKASPPTISAEDSSNPGVSLTSGVVFDSTDVTVTRPASTTIHYRTRQDAGDWSAWSTAVSDSVFTILDNGPRDGAVVTVQAYASRPGYRDSDMAVTSFSYLVLTVAPPILTNAFTTGETYGRNLEIVLASADTDADIYYSLDGSVPSPADSPLFSGSISGTDDTVYGQLTTGEPLYINAVCVVGGRISPVSTYWCRADATPPGDVTISTPQRYHESIRLSWDTLAADDTYIVEYKTSSASAYTEFDGTVDPAGTDLTGLTNGQAYDLRIRSVDKYGNYQTDGVAVSGLRPYSVTHAGDTTDTAAAAYVGSFRQAVAVADSGDTIVFDPAVFDVDVIDEDDTGVEISLVNSILLTKSVIIEGDTNGNNYPNVVLDGRWDGISVSGNQILLTTAAGPSFDLELNSVVLQNGFSANYGGALWLSSPWNVDVVFCRFRSNRANTDGSSEGGAIYNFGDLTITDSFFNQNSSAYCGGAISSRSGSSLTITNSEFKGNSGDIDKGTYGGAIRLQDCVEGDVRITDCLFENNETGYRGGAIFGHNSGGITIDNCVFSNNTVDYYINTNGGVGGGAVFLNSCGSTISSCYFVNNSTLGSSTNIASGCLALGGDNGPSSDNGEHTVEFCLFYDNTAEDGPASGLYVFDDATVALDHSLFYANDRGDVFNSRVMDPPHPSTLTITDCIANTIKRGSNISGILNITHSLITTLPSTGNFANVPNLTPAYQLSSNPIGNDNEWGTADDGLRPLAASPANLPGTANDVGCYLTTAVNPAESTSRIYVVDGGVGSQTGYSWVQALSDPQEAIDLAAWYGKSSVWVAEGIYVPKNDPNIGNSHSSDSANNHFTMVEGVSVYGGFAGGESTLSERTYQDRPDDLNTSADPWEFEHETVFSGQQPSDWSAHVFYHPDSDQGLTSETKLNGVTVTRGSAHDAWTSYSGGGICNMSSNSLSLEYCIFKENYSNYHNTSCPGGGAIFQQKGSIDILGCFFTANGDSYENFSGGAIALVEAVGDISDSVFWSNTTGDVAGAIFCGSSTLRINNCHVQDNSANVSGGAILARTSALVITDSFFKQNITNVDSGSGTGGGAIFAESCQQLDIIGSDFQANGKWDMTAYGGALYITSPSAISRINIVNSNLVDNVSRGSGGAVYYDMGNASSFMNIYGSKFIVNRSNYVDTAGGGGALYLTSVGTVNAVNSLFVYNNSEATDGSFCHGAVVLVNSTATAPKMTVNFLGCATIGNLGRTVLANFGHTVNIINGTSFFDQHYPEDLMGQGNWNVLYTTSMGTTTLLNCLVWDYAGGYIGSGSSGQNIIDPNLNLKCRADGDPSPTFSEFAFYFNAGSNLWNGFSDYLFMGATGNYGLRIPDLDDIENADEWGDSDDGLIPSDILIRNQGDSAIYTDAYTAWYGTYLSVFIQTKIPVQPRDLSGGLRLDSASGLIDFGAYEQQ